LQRFVGREGDGFADMRFFVSGGEVIAAMTRRSAHWITNVKLGARPEWLDPAPAMIDLALRAAAAADAEFAGVDMIFDAAGEPQILEVNSMPGWRGLQKVAPFSIADRLARDFLARMGVRPAEGAIASVAQSVE
jgi:glutathione synthase/RimK-type ligase-like ATP-grasp enzyme